MAFPRVAALWVPTLYTTGLQAPGFNDPVKRPTLEHSPALAPFVQKLKLDSLLPSNLFSDCFHSILEALQEFAVIFGLVQTAAS